MAETYIDRGMLKWQPFQSLPEQGDDLKSLYEKQHIERKPTLSIDQYEAMQYVYETCYHEQRKVRITLFQDHKKRTVEGIIIGVDTTYGVLFLDTMSIHTKDMLAIDPL